MFSTLSFVKVDHVTRIEMTKHNKQNKKKVFYKFLNGMQSNDSRDR